MSGVIDAQGVQWEHCGGCKGEGTPDYSERGKWVRIDDLTYEPPSEQYPYGRDLCFDCAMKSDKDIDFDPQTITIQLPEKYLGVCCRCLTNEATHEIYIEFETPVPAMVIDGVEIPEAKGATSFACDACDPKE